jgi:hypothetical protein
MIMDAVIRARMILEHTKRAPCMVASCREALMAHVCGVTSVVSEGFNTYEFYGKHIKVRGSAYVDMLDPVDDDWARGVIDDALTHFPKE